MISDEDLAKLKAARGELGDVWLPAFENHIRLQGTDEGTVPAIRFVDDTRSFNDDTRRRDFCLLAYESTPALIARLEFAERCVADLHDERSAAELLIRYHRALERIIEDGEMSSASERWNTEHLTQLAREALEGAP